MKNQNTAVAQLGNALDILKDYPGIENILDLNGAKTLLKALSKTNIGLVPSFADIDQQKIDALVEEDKNTVEEWIEALNSLKGVGAQKDTSYEDDTVIFGGVPGDMASLIGGTDKGEIYFSFKVGNKAEFNEQEGTWEEIYLALVKHVNEKLHVPDLPKVE